MLDEVDVVICGGVVVTEAWSGNATVLVKDGRVAAVLDPEVPIKGLSARRVIDAQGKLVIPGGVDPHCHLAIPLGSFVTLDSFETASIAALVGGTTTIIDFAIPATGQDPIEALDMKFEMATESRCDYAFHGCVNRHPENVDELIQAFAVRGVRTIKLFTTYRGELMVDMETIEEVMRSLRTVSGLTYIHAEENNAIETAQNHAALSGQIAASGMAMSRPEFAEEDAVRQVLAAAERVGAPVYFVHQSIPNAVLLVAEARKRGVAAYSESCPHYLILDDSCYENSHPERFVCCPPIRSAGTKNDLGKLLGMGFIDTIGSDHCCYSAEQKAKCSHDVRIMPNGLPGVETRLSVLWSEYVETNLISARDFVRMISSNPAKLNGIYPRKGTIAPGSDADLVIFDPEESRVLAVEDLHMDTDYTPYEGTVVKGWPTLVMARGRIVVENGVVNDPGAVGELLSAQAIEFW